MRIVRHRVLALCASGALAFPVAALAADDGAAASVHQEYLREREACLSGKSGEDRKTCLREAGAAQVEARRGTLAEGRGEDYEANRLARCNVHKDPQEREYCIRRMKGEGTVSGSVAEGGVLRKLVVTVPADEGSPGMRR
jgi:hypothetical protein